MENHSESYTSLEYKHFTHTFIDFSSHTIDNEVHLLQIKNPLTQS